MHATISLDDAILQVLAEYNTGIIVSDLARELWARYPSMNVSVLCVGKVCKRLAEEKRLRRYVGYGPASRAGDVLVKANLARCNKSVCIAWTPAGCAKFGEHCLMGRC